MPKSASLIRGLHRPDGRLASLRQAFLSKGDEVLGAGRVCSPRWLVFLTCSPHASPGRRTHRPAPAEAIHHPVARKMNILLCYAVQCYLPSSSLESSSGNEIEGKNGRLDPLEEFRSLSKSSESYRKTKLASREQSGANLELLRGWVCTDTNVNRSVGSFLRDEQADVVCFVTPCSTYRIRNFSR